MEKTVVFSENDSALIERIEVYQKENGKSFQEAVKELCEMALENDQQLKWRSF